MRIAYSCAGEGFGHVARMIALAPLLEKENDIRYFVPVEARTISHWSLDGKKTHWLPSFTFVHAKDGIRLFATIVRSIALLVKMPSILKALSDKLEKMGIDAILSDFDPFLSRAGRIAGIPVVQFNHPGIVGKYRPHTMRSALVSIGINFLEGPFDARIHSSFYGGDVGPIIREKLRSAHRAQKDHIVVNMNSRIRPSILAHLSKSGIPFQVFPNAGQNYEKALTECKAVISTAGHQTIAEALSLSKPVLVIPQRGQWEQELNAKMLVSSGAGMSCGIHDFKDVLPRFLSSLSRLKADIARERGFLVDDDTSNAAIKITDALYAAVCKRRNISIVPREKTCLQKTAIIRGKEAISNA